jgi:Uncharacterised MFS-type transporter YbfB
VILTGLIALAFGVSGQGPDTAWVLLGMVCAFVAAATWRPLLAPVTGLHDQEVRSPPPLTRSGWALVACYGVFGFGYIIPATFIPATARALVNDPAVFGWIWPVFGLAAAASTVAISTIFRATPPRRVAAWSLAVMSIGVAAPLYQMSIFSLVVSSLCVGGTFMVMTMAGAQEARRIAVGSSTRLMAALTSAFALGQMAGPLVISVGSARNAVALASGSAVALLLLSSVVLLSGSARAGRTIAPWWCIAAAPRPAYRYPSVKITIDRKADRSVSTISKKDGTQIEMRVKPTDIQWVAVSHTHADHRTRRSRAWSWGFCRGAVGPIAIESNASGIDRLRPSDDISLLD